MGRLDNIIERNNARPSEKVMVTLVLSGIVLVLLLLAVFTDLGMPPVPAQPPGRAAGSGAAGAPAEPPPGPANHVHGVLLRSPPANRPAH